MQNLYDGQSTPDMGDAAASSDGGSTSLPKPSRTRRLSDQITASFYEACRIGNLHAARQLAEALDCEVARSTRQVGTDRRENDGGRAAVWARYELEVAKARQEQEHSTSSVA